VISLLALFYFGLEFWCKKTKRFLFLICGGGAPWNLSAIMIDKSVKSRFIFLKRHVPRAQKEWLSLFTDGLRGPQPRLAGK
jgi:hypothetical protein